jgi:outer membrane receptor protein involved in Fe transport
LTPQTKTGIVKKTNSCFYGGGLVSNKKTKLLISAATSIIFALGGPAYAQQSDQSDTTTSAEQAGDIVVTARRQGERLMDVPVVVSAMTKVELERYDSSDLTSIGQLTPSVIVANFGANGGGSIAIRGISSPANQTGFEQAVSVAIDGVQSSNGHIAQLGFFDLQQTEILKGPQALFFGKNNTAGVISLTTADPTPVWMVSGKAGYEFVGDEVQLEGVVSGPITDSLGMRIAVKYANLDGWMRNTAQPMANPFYNPASGAPASAAQLPGTSNPRPGSKELLARGTLLFEPESDFKVKLKVFGARTDDAGPGVALQNIGPCAAGFPSVYGIPDPSGDCRPDRYVSTGDVPTAVSASMPKFSGSGINQGHLRAFTSSLSIEKGLGDLFVLNSLSGYSNIKYEWFGGLDHTVFSQLAMYEHTDETAFSQEFRLTSRLEGPLNFMIGAYYSHTELNMNNDVSLRTSNYSAALDRFDSFANVPSQKGKSLSAFTQVRWNLVPEVELAGGVRWSREEKRMSQYNSFGVGPFATQNTVFATSIDKTPGVLAGRFVDENVSPELTLTWHPEPNKTVFAAYRTGFKAGGFGLTNPMLVSSTIDSINFESEKAKGFEIGAKGLFLENRLRLSVAAFRYKFSNLQVNTYDPAALAYNINNAGELKQTGAEMEANLRVNDILAFHGAVAYVHNRFHNFVGQCYAYTFPTGTVRATATPPPNCSFINSTALTLQQDFEGRAPARSPEWSGNIGAVATIPLGTGKLEFTADGQFSDSYYAADTLVEASKQDAFWLLNGSVSYTSDNDLWKLALIGKNLSNEYYLSFAMDRTGGASIPGAIGEQRAVVSRGREIMLQASFKY